MNDNLSLVPPRWWVCIGVAPSLVCLLILGLAPMDAFGRWLWGSLGVALLVGGLAVLRNRIVLEEHQLSLRGVFSQKRVDLSQLRLAIARPMKGRHWSFWELCLEDAGGSRVRLRLNGFPAEDRARLLDAISEAVMSAEVQRDGPIEHALADKLWWPARR